VAFPAGHGAVDWGGGALWILVPAMSLSMGIGPWKVGLLFAAVQVATGIAHLLSGLVGDTLRNRGNFLLATFWWVALAQLAASFLDGYWMVVMFLALASAGAAAWHPVAMGTMVQQMPDRRAFALAIHSVGGTIAEVAAPLLVGFLLIFLDWRQVLQVNTIPAIAVGLIFLRLARMMPALSQESKKNSNLSDLVKTCMRPDVLVVILMLLLHSMAVLAFMSMAPLYLQETRGFSSSLTGVAVSVFVASGAVVAPLIGRVSDMAWREPIAVIGLIGGGISAALIIIPSGTVGLFVLLALTGLLMLTVRPVIIAMALEKTGGREATVLGLILSIGEGAAALGAALAGILADVNLAYAIMLSAGLSVLAGLVPLCQGYGSQILNSAKRPH
jgi:FSR family fosmidomycin resistance protein-like MFS transporter